MRAIELNGVAVEANRQAFLWGRRAAVDLPAVERVAAPARPVVVALPEKLAQLIERHTDFLTAYQNAAYARRYRDRVEQVRAAVSKAGLDDKLTRVVASNLFKLMAYKDEYEVARLYTDPEFEKQLQRTFEGDLKIRYNLAPPLLAKRDTDGHLRKTEFGPWMKHVFGLLARLKGLRHTAFDPFGYTEERKTERRLIGDYESMIDDCLAVLSADNTALIIELAALPEKIRGFGHIKANNIAAFYRDRETLLRRLHETGLVRAA
jgi:indolepyruvate ferredoxin oxidoreductase